MKYILATLWAECLKIRRSRILPGSVIFFILVSSMMSLVMFVQIHPGIAGKLGMIGDKAALLRFGEPDWPSFIHLLIEGLAAVGMVGSGFLATWIFGREYSDNTLKDLLALPVSRLYIVISKFIALLIWFAILAIIYLITGLSAGILIGLSGLAPQILLDFLRTFMVTSALVIILCPPVAFLASLSRGYMLPIGFVILTLILANFSGLVGLGPYFPWAISTSLAGLAATIFFWQNADQK